MVKLWTLLFATSLGLVVSCYYLFGRVGLLIGIAFSLLLILLVRLFGERQILKIIKAKPLQGHDPWGTEKQLHLLCARLGTTAPALYLAPIHDPYSFALRFSGSKGTIVLSTGLLKKINGKELSVVLAYHLIHLQHQNSMLCGLTTITNHSLLLLGKRLDRVWSLRGNNKHEIEHFSPFFKTLAALISRASVLPKVHHRYDKEVSQLMGDPRLVAETLWKLHNLTENLSETQPFCSQHLLIVNPLTISQKPTYLRSHPAVEQRIEQLTGHFPL